MADPTPPSDIPDPASATPASPVPNPGPKRIRSMPDRPTGARPTGTVRSTPEPTRSSSQVSGSYVDTLSKEKSWGRAVAILWSFFLVMLVLEGINATCYLLAGKVGWPLAVDVVRIGLVYTLFIALWSGLRWLQPLTALAYFVAGAWLLTDFTLSYRAYPKLMATGQSDWAVYSSIEAVPKVLLALLCLVTAAYVAFSDDVREFLVHRRLRGRIWSALLSAVVVYGGMILVFAAPIFYGKWMQEQYADAQRYGDETLRKAAETWEPNVLDAKLDSAYAKAFSKADRAATFVNFKALGRVKKIDPAPVVARAPMPQYPLQDKQPIPQGIDSQTDSTRKWFELNAKYTTANIDFEHGHGKFGFDLARSLSGPWRIMKLNVETVQYDARPKPEAMPAPDATPAAPADPAAPAASPAPAASSPVPTASPAASPAATVAPSASPVASAAPSPTASPVSPTASPTS